MPAFIPANGAIEAAISIAVLVIAFIGWLVQIAGQAKGQQPGPANRPRPVGQREPRRPAGGKPDERLRNEIDVFLREVSGGRPRNPREEEVALEIIPEEDEEDKPRRLIPATVRSKPSTTSTSSTTAASVRAAPAEPAVQLSEWDREQIRRREQLLSNLPARHLESTSLGRELRQHVEQFAEESRALRNEKEQAERRLAEARAEIQSMRAQVAAGPGAAPVGAAKSGSRFAALLKNRKSVQDAIVINEVLSRPRVLRRG
ncbi:MAG: hypothetical protein WBC44_17440 [Planctomycetaceae bacterium]